MEQVTHGAAAADLERRLRLIVGAAPNAIVMGDSAGRIMLASARAEQLFGYPREEMLSLRITDLLPEWRHEDGALLRGTATEVLARRSDGTQVPVRVGLTPMVVSDERFVLISLSDPVAGSREAVAGGRRGTLIDSIPFSLIETDPSGLIVAVNPAATRLLGRGSADLVGRPLSVVDASAPAAAGPLLADALAARAGTERERDYQRGDGTTVPVTEGITRLHDDDGATTGYLASAYDITKHRQARAAVLFMASHDALTNLPNRSMLVRHLVGAISRAKAEGTDAALVLLDLDHFKRVNDSLGHHAGDVLLLRVADRLKRGAPHADMVARLGGDEFVVLFTGIVDTAALTADIQELLRGLTAPVEIQGTELAVTVSAGGVLCPRDADNPSAALRLADTAMYHAKAAGRNSFAWFAEPMLDAANERTSMASNLRAAMRGDELSVAYQPQFALDTGEVIGFEALARWHSPVHGQVRPDRFIPVAEESGMIVELGSWILERACQDVAQMQRVLGRKLRLAVNCSPRQLHHDRWIETVAGALQRSGLTAEQLELEITEGVLMDDRWDVLEVLRGLRERGVSIAIDDFGQGYSSLAYLTRFPIDELKIDRAFVQRIQPDTPHAPIVDAIIGMAHALGLQVVAEGVETEQQARYLHDRGCERAQGFLFSSAVGPEQAVERARVTAPVTSTAP